jgi:hypothetical protein
MEEHCLLLLYFKALFVHYSLYDRENQKHMKREIREIHKNVLQFFPLRVICSYYFPLLAAFIYPIWRQMLTLKLLVRKGLNQVLQKP